MSILRKYQDGKPLYISDPKEYKFRKQMYDDSLSLHILSYNQMKDLNLLSRKLTPLNNKKDDFKLTKEEYTLDNLYKAQYDKLKKVSPRISKIVRVLPEQSDFYHKTIKPTKSYDSGYGSLNFLYKKPVQSVEFKKDLIKKSTKPVTKKKPAVTNILPAKKLTNFEQRIQNPTKQIDNADGTTSTHKMMSFEADGKYYAAPTIVEQNGKLVELNPEQAIDYALKNKEFKVFGTEAEAQAYAEGEYKKGTPLEEKTVTTTQPAVKLVNPNQVTAYRTQTVMLPDGSFELRKVPYYTSGEGGTNAGSTTYGETAVKFEDLTPQERAALKYSRNLVSAPEGVTPSFQRGGKILLKY